MMKSKFDDEFKNTFFHFCKISTKILSKSGLETKSPYISKHTGIGV